MQVHNITNNKLTPVLFAFDQQNPNKDRGIIETLGETKLGTNNKDEGKTTL